MSAFDDKTGQRVTTRLKVPWLEKDAVPSQLPNCPLYLSSSAFSRESPVSRNARLYEVSLHKGLAQSVVDDQEYQTKKTFTTLSELMNKLQFLDTQYWHPIRKEHSVAICHLNKNPHPNIQQSVVIESDLKVHAYFKEAAVSSIGHYIVPSHISDINVLEQLLCKLRELDMEDNT